MLHYVQGGGNTSILIFNLTSSVGILHTNTPKHIDMNVLIEITDFTSVTVTLLTI